MKSSKKYYKNIDLIRVLACIAVLFYHLNILKGGYLAVCIFFVLSGYLSCVSLFKKDKISLKEYYKNRLLKIYIPLLIVVFVTIGVISFIPSIKWLNLKPETLSVLLGYNNFWQLSANLDYFARHINSPFIHLWYIGILLQFDLIFPFIFKGLKKLEQKYKKVVPCIVIGILSIIFMLYFYINSLANNIMFTYYSTFTRVFSLLFGVTIGFIYIYYGLLIPNFKRKKNNITKKDKTNNVSLKLIKENIKKVIKNENDLIFYLYIIILIFLFIFIDSKSVLFPYSMILTTLISCRLISYGTLNTTNNLNIFDKIIKSISKISYEIYLIQYPLIFLFQNTNTSEWIKIPLIIIITIGLSYVLNFIIDLKNNKYKKLRYILIILVGCLSLYGVYSFIFSKDYSKEMKNLEKELQQNKSIIEEKQKEYKKQLEQEQENYEESLNELEKDEKNIETVITNLKVVGVGDSVMLGAVENLYKKFPKGYFDAKISRTTWVAHGILNDLKNNNMLGDIVVLNLGANGDCSEKCKKEVIKACGDRHIFWLTVTNDKDVNVNKELFTLSDKYNNLHIIDWEMVSKGHNEYFYADGIHLTPKGRDAYTNAIYDSIYSVYLEEYKNKKEELINDHEFRKKNKITFYGNDILLNAFDNIQENFETSKFNINKNYDYKKLKKEIKDSINNNSLTNKIVFVLDNLSGLSISEYKKLLKLCSNKQIYVVAFSQKNYKQLSKSKNIIVINFYEEIKKHPEYLMVDGIHLTAEGNKALSQILEDKIK